MKKWFCVWSVENINVLDSLIEDLEEMKKDFKPFCYVLWDDTLENRGSCIKTLELQE